MKKITIRINQHELAVSEGRTVWEAADSIGIAIPTLCFKKGLEHFTSCMLCVVYDQASGSLIPSCSLPVSAGMEIETEHPLINEARRDTLEFLLAEHLGDCAAPCQRTCPAHLNIPLMLRQIREGDFSGAIITIKKTIPLPATLGRICPAPCEKGCKRKYHDDPLAICLLKRFVADHDLGRDKPYLPEVKPYTGKNVAIVGSGPAGLAAAFYLSLEGHRCTVYDKNPKAGGAMRYSIPREVLPDEVLNAEIDLIRQLGVTLVLGPEEGRIDALSRLTEKYQAVVLAVGSAGQEDFKDSELAFSSQGIQIDRRNYQSSQAGIFACGGAIGSRKTAVRSLGEGRELAQAIHRFLKNDNDEGVAPFHSIMEKLGEGEIEGYLQGLPDTRRFNSEDLIREGYREEEAKEEARRCFSCQCQKPVSCRLREFATLYGATQPKILKGKKGRFSRLIFENGLVYEAGKCIKCGLCVRIVRQAGDKDEILGVSFTNRGFDILLRAPFKESLDKGLADKTGECILNCPTGALAWEDSKEEEEY